MYTRYLIDFFNLIWLFLKKKKNHVNSMFLYIKKIIEMTMLWIIPN
jgi:hypothetical protein